MAKRNISTYVMAMIPAGVALNVVANTIVTTIRLPVYLNNIGTMLNAITLGPLWGCATAFLTNSVIALMQNWVQLVFSIVGMVVACLTGLLFRCRMCDRPWKIVVSGIFLGLIAGTMSTIIATFMFGGFTGAGADVVVAGMLASGQKILTAAFWGNVPANLIDKVLSLWIVVRILKMFPVRLLPNADYVRNALNTKTKKKKEASINPISV